MNKKCNTISVRLSDKELAKLNDLATRHGGKTNAIKALINQKPMDFNVIEQLDLSDMQKQIIEEVTTKIGCNTYYVIRRFMAAGINQYLIEEASVIRDGMHSTKSGGGGN